MAQVAIAFGKRCYRFDCDDGEAERLRKLAAYLTETLDKLVRDHGAIGDERLILMAALTLADELFEARADIDNLLDDGADPEDAADVEQPGGDSLSRALNAQIRKGG